jgi:hypothetical protein
MKDVIVCILQMKDATVSYAHGESGHFCRWNSYVNCVRCSGPYLDEKFVVHDGIFDSVITSMMDYLMVWIVSMMWYSVVWSARVMDYPIVWTVNHEGIFDGMAVSMMGCSMVWITSMVGIFDSVNCKHDRNIRSVNCRYDGTLIVWL